MVCGGENLTLLLNYAPIDSHKFTSLLSSLKAMLSGCFSFSGFAF